MRISLRFIGSCIILVLSSIVQPCEISAQSIFDKFEDFLINRNFEIHYGPQNTWYKKSNIRYVDLNYQRDIEFQSIQGHGNDDLDFFLIGEFGVPQFRIDFGIDLSEKYTLSILATHLTYEVIVDRTYYRLGVWNGENVSDSIYFRDIVSKLEHSNGINIWNFGIGRKFKVKLGKQEKHFLFVNIKPNIGIILTASQGSIINPDNVIENYDQGNSFSGVNYAITNELKLTLFRHLDIGINFNYFEMFIHKAKLSNNAYTKHTLRGSNYGLFLGYKF